MLERPLRRLAGLVCAIRCFEKRQSRMLQLQQATAPKLQRPRQPATTEEVGILLFGGAGLLPLAGFPWIS